jgi:hypothetical protein
MPARLISGGQSGVDRAALDFAIARGIPYGGWCPRGGWAEDHPRPPGLLAPYPALRETPSADPAQRTRWNVRDSAATLILDLPCREGSAGTEATEAAAIELGRPLLRLGVNELLAAQPADVAAPLDEVASPPDRAVAPPDEVAVAEPSNVLESVERWSAELPEGFALNVAGPRQSEPLADAYASARRALEILFG